MGRALVSLLGLIIVGIALAQQVDIVQIGKSRYFISSKTPYIKPLDWYQAYGYCRSIGMELLSMPSYEESENIINFLSKEGLNGVDFWTSGRRLSPLMYLWLSTGRVFNSSFNLFPQNRRVRRAKEFRFRGSRPCVSLKNGQWNTTSCDEEEKSFICQLTRCSFINYVVTTRVDTRSGIITKLSNSSGNRSESKRPAKPLKAIHFPSESTDTKVIPKNQQHSKTQKNTKNTKSPMTTIVQSIKSALNEGHKKKDPSEISEITSLTTSQSSRKELPVTSIPSPSASANLPSSITPTLTITPIIATQEPLVNAMQNTPSSGVQFNVEQNEILSHVPQLSTLLEPPTRDPPGVELNEPGEISGKGKSTISGRTSNPPTARDFSRRAIFRWALTDPEESA